MSKMIAPCGIRCDECPAYIATQANDKEALTKMAADAAKQFGVEVSIEQVYCDGCLAKSDRKCGYCSECEIRACVLERNIANCAECNEYACDKLNEFLVI